MKLGEFTASQLFLRCNELELQLQNTKEYYEQVFKDGEIQIKKYKQIAEEYKSQLAESQAENVRLRDALQKIGA